MVSLNLGLIHNVAFIGMRLGCVPSRSRYSFIPIEQCRDGNTMAPYSHPRVGFGERPVAAAARMRGMVDFLARSDGKRKSWCNLRYIWMD